MKKVSREMRILRAIDKFSAYTFEVFAILFMGYLLSLLVGSVAIGVVLMSMIIYSSFKVF